MTAGGRAKPAASTMEPTKELIDALEREEILRARAMRPEDKLLAGPRLFERACRLMASGVRDEFPDADDAEVDRIVRQRLELARRLEETA